MNININKWLEVIELFEDDNKFYWIDKLPICEADKGFIVLYFNLLNGVQKMDRQDIEFYLYTSILYLGITAFQIYYIINL